MYRITATLLLALAVISSMGCQTAADGADAAVAAVQDATGMDDMSVGKAFASDLTRLKAGFLAFAEAMPEDKYDYKPVPEVDSFGGHLLHAVGAAGGIGGAIGVDLSGIDMESAKTKAEIMAVIEAGFDKAAADLGAMTNAQFDEAVTLFGNLETNKRGAADIIVNHAIHHKGGLVVYLRMNGITPPAFAGI